MIHPRRSGQHQRERCVVIGPVSGEHRTALRWLRDLVRSILPERYDVDAPGLTGTGDAMRDVIRSCDRAHLVIANVTGTSPNVVYEVAVLDAMGRACIPVNIDVDDEDEDRDRFDRASFRSHRISTAAERRTETEQTLRGAIQEVLRIRDEGDLYDNPLTDFFGVPLSSCSSAYGLARGYYDNLLKPAVAGIVDGTVSNTYFDPAGQPRKVLQVVIPDRLSQATRGSLGEIVRSRLIRPIRIAARGRQITLYEWEEQPDRAEFRWVDVPTTITALRNSVERRLGRGIRPDPATSDYVRIEEDEIDQFARGVLRWLRSDGDQVGVHARSIVELVRWSTTSLPGG